ncbi:hypothetical protein Tco_0167594 [Tanacetum coccineum]
MDQSSNKVILNSSHYSDNASSLDNDSMQIEYDSLCEISLKIINKNKILKTKSDLLEKEILELNEKIKKLERSKEVEIAIATMAKKGTEHVFSPPMSSRSDFVITRKKLIHNSIDESKKPSLKPSPKSGIGYVKTESRLKTPPLRRKLSSQSRYNTPQSRRNSRQPIHQNFYPRILEQPTKSRLCTYGKLYPISISQSIATNAGDVCLRTCLEPDEWIKESGCSKHMTSNKSLFSTYKAYDGGTDKTNITRKLSKNGQTRTWETKEHKRSQRFKAKAKKSSILSQLWDQTKSPKIRQKPKSSKSVP